MYLTRVVEFLSSSEENKPASNQGGMMIPFTSRFTHVC